MNRLRQVLYGQLALGTDRRKLALTCAVGVSCGTLPLLGLTTVLCLICGFLFKLNQPILQAINFVMIPVQLLLIPVFGFAALKLGRPLAVDPHPEAIIRAFAAGPADFLRVYGELGLRAVAAWALSVPLLAGVVYNLSLKWLAKGDSQS